MTLETFNMVQDTYTPLISEVLKKVHNAKTKAKKVELLKKYDCDALRVIIKSSFDPNIEWVIPQGEVPFEANDAEEGTEHTVLRREYKKLYRFVKGGDDTLVGFKRENMFIQMLEGLHKSEADLVISAKDKKLHQAFKGLSENVVKEAFQWNDSYNKE
jgi:hypothetical protein